MPVPLAITALLAIAIVALALLTAPAGPPAFAELKSRWRSSEAWLLDRHGEPIQRLRLDPTARRLAWVALEDVPAGFVETLVASEDRRFHAHAGIDWRALFAAAWGRVSGGPARGASTITMQLAGLVEANLRRGSAPRTWLRKIEQMRYARALESRYSKREILEAYLNLVTFRGELQGVGAMAQGLFGKAPHGLDRTEAAIAAALVRAPNARPGRVATRACALLGEDASGCAALAGRVRLALAGGYAQGQGPSMAPHLARRLVTAPDERVRSTLDAGAQRAALAALRHHLVELSGRNVEDGAVLVLDNASGEVLAWVGSSGELSAASEVDGVTALRQAGSTLKPFLYGLALEERRVTAASLLEDAPVELATATGLYIPRNYTEAFRGPVSVRSALAGSLNIPAVRMLVLTGTERFVERLRRFGFASLAEEGDWYGYSLALGGADVTLAALANAYRALANGGVLTPVATRTGGGTPEGVRVLDEAASFVIADILADRAARAPTFGLANVLETPFWAAAKTGTTRDMRDNWCIGFSRRYTVAVWVGNASGAPMHDVSGVSGAAPVWRDVMLHLHRSDPGAAPRPPAGLVERTVRFEPNVEPSRQEYFLAGTEREIVRTLPPGRRVPRIAYPADGTVLALDPDIPPRNQRIILQASRPDADARWVLNGTRLGSARAPVAWFPAPGRHTLRLVGADEAVLDEIQFEVRGAWAGNATSSSGCTITDSSASTRCTSSGRTSTR